MAQEHPLQSANRDDKIAVSDQVYQAVLNFFNSSIRDERLLDAASPLPPLLSRVLQSAAELIDKQPPEGDAARIEEIRRAVNQLAERILFLDHENYYRILGLNIDAEAAQIKNHYKWLTRLLFPGSDIEHWNESNAALLNRAYSVLRDPAIRKAYTEEFLSNSAADKKRGTDQEATAGTGVRRGAASEDAAPASVQNQLPSGEPTTGHTTAQPGRVTEGSTFIAANLNRVNPTPFAGVGTPRISPDSVPAAAVNTGPVPMTEPVTAAGVPLSQESVPVSRIARVSLAVAGLLIVAGAGVWLFLGDISLPFMDHGVEIPTPPMAMNQPGTAGSPLTTQELSGQVNRAVGENENRAVTQGDSTAAPDGTGQVAARSEPEITGLAGEVGSGPDTVGNPINDASPPAQFNGNQEPLSATPGGGTADFGAVPDKQVAPPAPPVLTPHALSAQDASAPATEAITGKAESAPIPPSPSSRVAKPMRESPARHVKTVSQTKQAGAKTPSKDKDVAAKTSPPAKAKSSRRAESAPVPARASKPEVAKSAQGAKTAPARQPTPVKGADEKPSSLSADASVHPGAGPAVAAAAVQPLAGGEALAVTAAKTPPSPVPAAGSSTSPPTPESPFQAVTEQQLEILIKSFISSYEAGDLDIFMSLFSEDAHTKAQKDRESIRQAYNQFFQGTRNRRLKLLQGLQWKRADKGTLVGQAPFQLRLNTEDKRAALQYSGILIFHVENRSPHLLITQFDYEYKKKKE